MESLRTDGVSALAKDTNKQEAKSKRRRTQKQSLKLKVKELLNFGS